MAQIALHDLRLNPQQFWSLTPAEFMMILGRDMHQNSRLNRAGLDALMRAFPDQRNENADR